MTKMMVVETAAVTAAGKLNLLNFLYNIAQTQTKGVQNVR